MRNRLRFSLLCAAALGTAALVASCVEPPPKIPSIPASGFKLRVFAFGFDAETAVRTFDAVSENNPSFMVVPSGGDGEVVVGFEQDTGLCVEPTALCSLRVAYRVKNAQGAVVASGSELVSSNSDRCMNLCEKALGSAIAKIVDAAAVSIKGGGVTPPTTPTAEPSAEPEAAASSAPGKEKDPKGKKPPVIAAAAPVKKAETGLCSVGAGPRLQSEEVERRVGQVEALKRLGVIEVEDFECLRKAFLSRL